MNKLKVGVISTSRADYGIYFPLLQELRKRNEVSLKILAFGMHLSPKFGKTVDFILDDGFDVVSHEDSLIFGDGPYGISKTMGQVTAQMAETLKIHSFDLIICLGDRFEMYAAASGVTAFCIPLVHIHGGELTEGAIDQKFRNAISKLADLHFVSCGVHMKRVLQMGAKKETVFNVGSLGVEALLHTPFISIQEIEKRWNVNLAIPSLLATFHPLSTDINSNQQFANEIFKFLAKIPYQVIVTRTNADTMGCQIYDAIGKAKNKFPEKIIILENLGRHGYASFMKHSICMIGNSSSGVIEAASLGLPVLNIGNRQKGRECSNNIIHVEGTQSEMMKGLELALKLNHNQFKNIYEGMNTAKTISDLLVSKNTQLDFSFQDLPIGSIGD